MLPQGESLFKLAAKARIKEMQESSENLSDI